MNRAIRNVAFVAVLAAGILAVGCGGGSSSCASETPKLNGAPSCPAMMPNAPVQVSLQICPTCNQTDASCEVDLSNVSQGIIHFDTLVHACENSNSCPPSCSVSGVTCTFTTPGPGTYNLFIGDDPNSVPFKVDGTSTTCG